MQLVHSDAVVRVPPGTTPDYDHDNALLKLLSLVETQGLAAERDCYVARRLQYLFPIASLALYGPAGGDADTLDPTLQDNKVDFQKQNVQHFVIAQTTLVRGLARAGDWSGPFLRLSYSGSPASPLATAAGGLLGSRIKLYLKVGGTAAGALLPVPYVEASDRYEIELWGYTGSADLASQLGPKGRAALASGELVVRPDLVQGREDDFRREALEGRNVVEVAPGHALHPVLPLHVELAWADDTATTYD